MPEKLFQLRKPPTRIIGEGLKLTKPAGRIRAGAGLLAVFLAFSLAACDLILPNRNANQAARPTQTPEPTEPLIQVPLPETFRTQIMIFIEEGTKLDAMTGQGGKYFNFSNQFTSTENAFTTAKSFWPDGYSPASVGRFENALNGWKLVNGMWGIKVEHPEISEMFYNQKHADYQSILEYLENDVATGKIPKSYFNPDLRGLNYLLLDDTISRLMVKASAFFNKGKEGMLRLLEG